MMCSFRKYENHVLFASMNTQRRLLRNSLRRSTREVPGLLEWRVFPTGTRGRKRGIAAASKRNVMPAFDSNQSETPFFLSSLTTRNTAYECLKSYACTVIGQKPVQDEWINLGPDEVNGLGCWQAKIKKRTHQSSGSSSSEAHPVGESSTFNKPADPIKI